MVSWILIVVGAIDWGLIGIGGFANADWDILKMILGQWKEVLWIVYVLVGLAAIYEIVTHKHNCKQCGTSASAQGSMSM